MGEQGRGEVAARGGADDANVFRIEFPLGRAPTNGAKRASSILEHDRMPVAGGAETIFQNESGDSVLIEKAGVVFAFVGRKATVTAAGTNNESRTRGRRR